MSKKNRQIKIASKNILKNYRINLETKKRNKKISTKSKFYNYNN